ncbi:MAG: undecaprenyl-diphosphatase [Desulfobacteraceae bacterium]|nr:undecaprenyl-diphosphatase [Desulfobacteraceae bacterium]
METINIALFNSINAGSGLGDIPLFLATLLAEYLIWLVPLLLIFIWFRDRTDSGRSRLFLAFFSAMLALGINQLVGLFYQHPRPFMAGLGHTYLSHGADSSFPSDHVTVFCAVGLALCLDRTTRCFGAILGLAALPVAWARIYLGVHFPLDMVGAFGTAFLSVVVTRLSASPLEKLLCRPILYLYKRSSPRLSPAKNRSR